MNILKVIIHDDFYAIDNHPAIITHQNIIPYNELEKKVLLTATYLASIGIKENTKAAILSRNNPEYVVYLLALWSLNACAVPLNIKLSDTELTDIINFSDAEFLFYNEKEKRNLSVAIPCEAFIKSLPESGPFEFSEINPDCISVIIFTSGVSGKPKGAMHSLNDFLNSADNSQDLLSQSQADKWLASLPFYHIGGLSIITRTFRFGSSLIIPESLKHTDLRDSLDNQKPTLVSLVSTQLKRLLETDWKPGKELKNLLLGGGFANEELIKEAVSIGCKISNVYGSTETSALVTANSPSNVSRKPLSVGKPLGENKIFIENDVLKLSQYGLSGEVLIEGNSLFHGYYKDQYAASKKLINGKYHTGDIGYIDKDGDLFIQARRTDLIITGGENVNPIEVELFLNAIPGIKESCVFALPDKEWGQVVAAALVMNRKISVDTIIEFMRGKTAGFKVPKRFFPVEKLPRTSLGKIMREKVKEEIEILLS